MKSDIADIVIKNGILVTAKELKRADVYIKDGRVDGIGSADTPRSATNVIDASAKLVLPGIIDAHIHPVYADRIDTLNRVREAGIKVCAGGIVGMGEQQMDRAELIRTLEKEMFQAAEELDFERAARLRDRIKELRDSPELDSHA